MMSQLQDILYGSELRNKFIFFFIVLAAIPLLLLGGTSLYLINLSHQQDVSNLEIQLIDQKIEEVKTFLTDTTGVLNLHVSTDNDYIEANDQQFLLKGLLEENRFFEEVNFINLKGRETEKIIRGQELNELFDVSHLSKFTEATKGKVYISDIYYTLAGPFITVSSPVYNRSGQFIQIISAEVNISTVIKSVESAKLGITGYVVLLDRNGTLASMRGNVLQTGMDFSFIDRVSRMKKGNVYDGLAKEDRYESPFTHIAVVGAGKKIPELEWLLVVEWPISEVDAIIRDIRNQVINLTAFSTFAVIILAAFVALRLTNPIKELEKGIAEIEKGNFLKRVEIRTADELEHLGKAFNRMAQGLKQLQELKDEFVFVAAHELRSPVTVIRGYVSMVLRNEAGPLTKQAKEYLEQADKANQRLLQLVSDLLAVARSETGRIEIKSVSLDIRQPIQASVTELLPLAHEKSISLNYQYQEKLPYVLADETRIKEIMVNLAGNAIKYTPEKGSVWISHEVKDTMIITHIKDNGYGISKEAQEKLFEKFYRVQTDKTRSIIGTGLGLFIVKQLVEKMSGTIGIVSEEGQGSTFSFSLPKA